MPLNEKEQRAVWKAHEPFGTFFFQKIASAPFHTPATLQRADQKSWQGQKIFDDRLSKVFMKYENVFQNREKEKRKLIFSRQKRQRFERKIFI